MKCTDCKYQTKCDKVVNHNFNWCNLKNYADNVNGKWSGKLSEVAGWIDTKEFFKNLLR